MIQRLCSLLRMQPPVILNRGLLFANGATVPADGTDGYQTGCVFQHTDGDNNTALYVNEGSVTASQFNALTTGGPADVLVIGAFASLLKGSGIPISSTQRSSIVAYGDDNGLAIASSVYNTRSRMLLTVDQDGASIRALMGQLKLCDGVDVSTGIYTAVQGYVELAGDTSAETGSTFSCIDASLEIPSGSVLTVDSGGEACGIHVETTGAGTISATGTCAGILIDKASGAPDWTNGIIVKNSTRGVVLTGITAQAIDIQTSGVFRMGVEGTGIPVNNTYPYGLEIHTITDSDFAQPATGVSAGIYSRYEHSFDQVTATGHAAVFAKFRVKKDLKDGVHAAAYNYVEVSGGANTDIGGTATTTTTAGIFAIETDSGFILSAGHLNGIVVDSSIHATGTFTGTISGIRIKKSGSAKAWPTGIAIEASASTTGVNIGACTTGISLSGAITTGITIASTSTTDGIKISGTTPEDGVEVSSACTQAAFHVSGASASGLLIAGDCTTAAINITATGVPMGLLYNVDMTTQIGSNVEGIKVILERTADVVVGTSNILGAEFIVKQGSDSYAAGMAPQITGVRIAMGGANTKATVVGLKCETQSNGYVDYLGIFSVNDGCTLASGGAVLYVRSYPTAAKLLKIEQLAATTATDGICLTDNVGTGTITNLITISARNSTYLFNFDYIGTGCVSSGSDSTNCTHKIAVKVESGTRYLHLFSD